MRVLLVEDTEPILVLCKTLLERKGFEVMTAKSTEEAQTIHESGAEFDLIISDNDCPLKDSGVEWFQSIPAPQKLMLISGRSCDTRFVFLNKPFRVGEFYAAVEKALTTNPSNTD